MLAVVCLVLYALRSTFGGRLCEDRGFLSVDRRGCAGGAVSGRVGRRRGRRGLRGLRVWRGWRGWRGRWEGGADEKERLEERIEERLGGRREVGEGDAGRVR